jgi:hypothetical protein
MAAAEIAIPPITPIKIRAIARPHHWLRKCLMQPNFDVVKFKSRLTTRASGFLFHFIELFLA